jgi:selenide, water dikinase
VLRPVEQIFKPEEYPNQLVGLQSSDDAAVWRLDDQRALVMTTDFFTPVVDDPYDYGSIAATNSLSDVYAMGGKPFLALNIAALPADLPPEISSEIMRGGAEKAREAGVVIAGGHTIQDKEPKYGLVVLGLVDPHKMLVKTGMEVGDRLVITKPLGFGVTTTALKREQALAEDVTEAVSWMKILNNKASELAIEFNLHCATDVTGFSLLGHCWEMVQSSGQGVRIDFSHVPFLTHARDYAVTFNFPGGAYDNQEYFGTHVRFDPRLDEASQLLLFDPQTSGGLLLAVPPDKIRAFRRRSEQIGQPIWEIGRVTDRNQIDVI